MSKKPDSRQPWFAVVGRFVSVALFLATPSVSMAEQGAKTASGNVEFDSSILGWVMRGQTLGPFAVSENGRAAILTADVINFTDSLPRDLAQSSVYRSTVEQRHKYDRIFQHTIAFSDDGLHDGFVARDKYTNKSFYVIDGKKQARGDAAGDLTFAPDGSHAFVVFTNGRCRLYRDGFATELTARMLLEPAFSPNGKHLAVAAAPRDDLYQVFLDGELILERADSCSELTVSNDGRVLFQYKLDGEYYQFDGTKPCGPYRKALQMHTTIDRDRIGFIATHDDEKWFVVIDGKECDRTFSRTFPPAWSPSGKQYAHTAIDTNDEKMDVHLVVDGVVTRSWRNQTPGEFEITAKPVYSAKENFYVAASIPKTGNYQTVVFKNGKPIGDLMPVHAFPDTLTVSPFNEVVAFIGEEVAEGPQFAWVDGARSDAYELVNYFQFAEKSPDYVFVGFGETKTSVVTSRATYGPYDRLLALPKISPDGNAVAWVAVEDGDAFLCLNGMKSEAYNGTLKGASVYMNDDGTASCFMIGKGTGNDLWVFNAVAKLSI